MPPGSKYVRVPTKLEKELQARIATLEMAYEKVKDTKDWMDDHYTKWHEIQEYKDEVNKLKIHFETWNTQILRLQELTIIHEDPHSLINRLDNVERRTTELENMPRLIGAKMVERLDKLETRAIGPDEQEYWNTIRRVMSHDTIKKVDDLQEGAFGADDRSLAKRVEKLEKPASETRKAIMDVSPQLLELANHDHDLKERITAVEKRVQKHESWIEPKCTERLASLESDIRAINEEFIRLYRKIPDDNEPHQPTTGVKMEGEVTLEHKLFTDEDAKNYQHLYMKPEMFEKFKKDHDILMDRLDGHLSVHLSKDLDFSNWQKMVDRDLTKHTDIIKNLESTYAVIDVQLTSRMESLEWKHVGIEKRMQETLDIAAPVKCGTCGHTYGEHTMRHDEKDNEPICLKCRLDYLEAMIWHKPNWELKDDAPQPDPNDPLPGEEKHAYATRMGKLAIKRWEEYYGQK